MFSYTKLKKKTKRKEQNKRIKLKVNYCVPNSGLFSIRWIDKFSLRFDTLIKLQLKWIKLTGKRLS